ncbi:MAG: hypothetical protein LBK47_00080 [Prevotellaceae bacterium]|jgi:hypothetical protein|nr:hypothetical protein [Prevotellaceae bacterium]
MKLFSMKMLVVAGLAVVAGAFISSCKDDPNWQPTWAAPVVKEITLTVKDFMTEGAGSDALDNVTAYWEEFVEWETGTPKGTNDAIDSMAYAVLTDTTSAYAHYVDYTVSDGTPQLSDSARKELDKNGVTSDQMDSINVFLEQYFNSKIKQGVNPKRVQAKAEPVPTSNNASGSLAIGYLLSGLIDPTNIFATVGNLLAVMPQKYQDSLNMELDHILAKFDLKDTIALTLKSYAKDASSVKSISITMDVKNTMPIQAKLQAVFTDANNDSIHNIFDESKNNIAGDASKTISFSLDNPAQLEKVFNDTKYVSLKTSLAKDKPLDAKAIRELPDKGITFNLRVKIQAQMDKFLDF